MKKTLHSTLSSMLEKASNSQDAIVATMKTTVENSEWHREANVWVHTQMVVEEFLKAWAEFGELNNRCYFRAGVAALFHDFGKPTAEEERTNDVTGVVYRRYAGHEAISAGLFRDYATSPPKWKKLFGKSSTLTAEDIYVISVMVTHHLPYQYKAELTNGILATMIEMNESFHPFFMLLRSDSNGRISDNHDAKKAAVEDWIVKVTTLYEDHVRKQPVPTESTKVACLLVGGPGTGKTTIRRQLVDEDTAIFSMDELRIKVYGNPAEPDPIKQYQDAFKLSIANEEEFKNNVNRHMVSLFRPLPNIIVSDNTNLSRKGRRQFIAAAKQKKYMVIAVVSPTVSLHELIERNKNRKDHKVPEDVIIQMFHRQSFPTFDEVDGIIIN